jgi:hypothetical protein
MKIHPIDSIFAAGFLDIVLAIELMSCLHHSDQPFHSLISQTDINILFPLEAMP